MKYYIVVCKDDCFAHRGCMNYIEISKYDIEYITTCTIEKDGGLYAPCVCLEDYILNLNDKLKDSNVLKK